MLKNTLFEHSAQFGQGYGAVQERITRFTVAKDGTGDYEDLQSALNDVPPEGAEIKVKAGTYAIEDMNLGDNTRIIGDFEDTVIEITGSANGKAIDLSNNTNIAFEKCKLVFKGSWTSAGVRYHINLSNATNIRFINVYFENQMVFQSSSDNGIFGASGAAVITMIKCEFHNAGGGRLEVVFGDCDIEDSLIGECTQNSNVLMFLMDSSAGITCKNNKIISSKIGGIILLPSDVQTNQIIGNTIRGGFEIGDGGSSYRNSIADNYFLPGASSRIYLGSNADYNSCVGNVHDAANSNSGTGNVFSGDVQY